MALSQDPKGRRAVWVETETPATAGQCAFPGSRSRFGVRKGDEQNRTVGAIPLMGKGKRKLPQVKNAKCKRPNVPSRLFKLRVDASGIMHQD